MCHFPSNHIYSLFFPSHSLSLCLCVSLSLCLSVCVSVCVSVSLSLYLCLSVSVCVCRCVSDCLSVSLCSVHGQNEGPRLISRDWLGIQPPVDAAMVGRLYLSPKATATPPQARPAGGRGVLSKRRGRGRGQRGRGQKGRGQRGRQSRSLSYVEDFFSYNYEDYGDDDDYNRNGATHAVPGLASQSVPVQSVYFFKNGRSSFPWSHNTCQHPIDLGSHDN